MPNDKQKTAAEMPHNLEAEQSVLGCLAIDRDIQLDVLSQLSEEDFYSDKIRLQRGIEFYRVDNLHVDADMISGAVTVNKKKEEK